MSYNAGIIGIGISLPDKILTNFDLEKMVNTSDEWIKARTGINERRIAADEIASSDLAVEASLKALEMAKVKAEDVDMVIVCTTTPDMICPSTAAIVQDKIGAANTAAFDLSAACTGFIYGLTVAKQFVRTGFYKNILVIGVEVLSKITDYTDNNTCVLFGDGAGSVLVSRTDENGLIDEYLKAEGSGAKHLEIPAGGSRKPTSAETVDNKLHYLRMNGPEVFKFAVRALPAAVNKLLEKSGMKIEDIDYLVPHQANLRIIDNAAKRLGMPAEKIGVTVAKYGNMSTASIPVTLYEDYQAGKIKKGDKIVLVGFGAGLTYGSALIEWLI